MCPGSFAREKWHQPTRPLSLGDIALIVDDNTPRGRWTLGRVIEPIAGKDGAIIRQANVRTTNGKILRRPKLIVLEPGPDGGDDADRCRAARAGDVADINNPSNNDQSSCCNSRRWSKF